MPILGVVASGISGHLWAPAQDYVSISTATVDASHSNSITFSSIPTTYTHLQIRGIVKMSTSAVPQMRFNTDTTSNYYMHTFYANPSVGDSLAYGTSGTLLDWTIGTGSTVQFAPFVTDILDYANVNKYKVVRSINGTDNNIDGGIQIGSGLWKSTVAISTISIFPNTGNFLQYSQFALYGVK